MVRTSAWPELYEWTEHATTEVYSTAAEHFAVAQVSALIKKYPLSYKEFGFTKTPEETAFEKFTDAERHCKLVNKRFRTLRYRFSKYRGQLEYMRSWIGHVLGDKPNLRQIYDQCGFSGGASIGVHGNATNLYRKVFADSWTVSSCAMPYALHALCSNEQILLSFMDERNGYVCYDVDLAVQRMKEKCITTPFNKVSFVPKTAKTDRSIAVEPLLNSFLQKGIDLELRGKLRKHGYDLSDQTRNANLARLGSIDGSLATVDLSSASDTISIGLAKFLLPSEWFDFLNRSRSANFKYGDTVIPYEKFVSMGNGFCFPLETLFFVAATRASIHFSRSVNKVHSVYGDDIIVPVEAVDTLYKLLAYCGFKVNASKSFNTGPFRESCGADWYEGQDVRPVYLDYHLSDDSRLMIFHNATYRGERTQLFFQEVRELIRDWVPWEQRLCRPLSAQPRIDKHLRDRGSDLQAAVDNGAFSVDQETFMGSRWSFFDRKIWNWRWREICTRPQADTGSGPLWNRAQYFSLLLGSPEGKLNLRRKTRLAYIMK